ncbi:MAG: mandelate racemase/muconate lactonizing enzyme family protein [Coriobacteriales bacterium]|jgi:L-alanine-DL-glutamate epimerase-like enolase superfamily enzyme
MKIERITATAVDLPLAREVKWATGNMKSQAHVLVRVDTDEGIQGISEAIPREHIYGESQPGMVYAINELIAPLIVGLDAFDLEKIHEKMGYIKRNLAAKGGIDVAIWDAIGKKLDTPLYKLFGGYRDSIEPSRILWMGPIDEMVEQASELNEKGYRAFKVKGGLNPDEDIARIEALREVVTPDTRLYIDGNMSYSYFGAKKVADSLRGKLDYFEEPIADTNERDRVRLAHSIDIPIVGDESNFTIYDVAHQIDIDALSVMMIKIPRSGFTYGRKIAALCEAFHRPMMIGSQSESALGAVAIIHMGCGLKTISYPCEFMDFDNPRASLINEHIDMRDGRVYPPQGPGLGVTLDEDAVSEYTVKE